MLKEVVPRLFSVYYLEEGDKVNIDPYYAQAFCFGLNEDVCYLFGQLSKKRLTREYYEDAFETIKGFGFKKAIYYAPHKRRSLGGDPIDLLPNFYCINLEE